MNHSIIKLDHVSHYFEAPGSPRHLVLDRINMTLPQNKIIALLGKSGSGKSTLLRIIAGLITPSMGEVSYHGEPCHGPLENVSMIFQSFALFPWLTIFENVALGLEAAGINPTEIRTRTIKALNLIGLDGFDHAYPKELSGGMRQRVGFARALVMNPEVLLMDEPFSALDVLTSETLRADLLDLWIEKIVPLKSILLVTHHIEEAVFLADTIMVLSSNPGNIITEITVDLPHPRDKDSVEYQKLVGNIYHLMTTQLQTHPAQASKTKASSISNEETNFEHIPAVSPYRMVGLLTILASPRFNGSSTLADLASDLHLSVDEMMPLIEALVMLHFAEIKEGKITISASGRMCSEGNLSSQKKVFAQHIVKHVPLAGYIRRIIGDTPNKEMSLKALSLSLSDKMHYVPDDQSLHTITTWGRYAGLFSLDPVRHVVKIKK
jgi:NitT/TauT family transport system ATP-binding protein